jgi:hypothetical protein
MTWYVISMVLVGFMKEWSLIRLSCTLCLLSKASYDRFRSVALEKGTYRITGNPVSHPETSRLYPSLRRVLIPAQRANEPIFPVTLPPNITFLNCANRFLDVNHLPASLTEICLRVSSATHVDYLPSRLKKLTLEYNSLAHIDHLPPHLEELSVYLNTDKSLDHLPPRLSKLGVVVFKCENAWDYLPSTLTELTLCSYFNQPIDHLPDGLRKLHLSDSFNQPVDNLPRSLEVVTFVGNFNLPVDHLPSTLKTIRFGHRFNQSVDHLPAALKTVEFGQKFNQPVDHLPDSLVSAFFDGDFGQPMDHLPQTLLNLDVRVKQQSFDCLPLGLQSLTLRGFVKMPIDNLPLSLTYLFVECKLPIDLHHLPPSLRYLRLYQFGVRVHVHHLPDSLVSLDVMGAEVISPDLPKSLAFLYIKTQAHDPKIRFPESLKGLQFISASDLFDSYPPLPANLSYLDTNFPFEIPTINRLTSLYFRNYHFYSFSNDWSTIGPKPMLTTNHKTSSQPIRTFRWDPKNPDPEGLLYGGKKTKKVVEFTAMK